MNVITWINIKMKLRYLDIFNVVECKVGDFLEHPNLGEGIIKEIINSGGRVKILCYFEDIRHEKTLFFKIHPVSSLTVRFYRKELMDKTIEVENVRCMEGEWQEQLL